MIYDSLESSILALFNYRIEGTIANSTAELATETLIRTSKLVSTWFEPQKYMV